MIILVVVVVVVVEALVLLLVVTSVVLVKTLKGVLQRLLEDNPLLHLTSSGPSDRIFQCSERECGISVVQTGIGLSIKTLSVDGRGGRDWISVADSRL